MRDMDLPLWLRSPSLSIIGFDDAEDEDEEESEESEEEDEDEEEESEEESEEEDEDEDEDDEESSKSKKGKSDTAGLKSALKKERTARREAAKEAKRLKRELDALKPPDDEDEESTKKEKAKATKDSKAAAQRAEQDRKNEEKSERLAAKFATNAVDTTLVRVAGEAKMPKFRDIDDALRLVNRADIDVEQDDEDPSEVEIDDETVRDALKDLAKKKPHLLLSKEEAAKVKTGSKFNRDKSKSKTKGKDALIKKYSALQR